MSTTSLEQVTVETAAQAVARLLPTEATVREALTGVAAVSAALPGPNAKAVSATIAGTASGTIIICLSEELAAAVENGPLGTQDLVEALTPALDDCCTALAADLGDIRHEAAQALDAELALSNATTHESVCVIPLANDTGVCASIVFLLDSGSVGFSTLSETFLGDESIRGVELLSDVEMGVTAELGRTRMSIRELLSLQPGSIVELDRTAGSPVDLLVNGTLVARGEVVVIDEEFGIRITEIIGHDVKG